MLVRGRNCSLSGTSPGLNKAPEADNKQQKVSLPVLIREEDVIEKKKNKSLFEVNNWLVEYLYLLNIKISRIKSFINNNSYHFSELFP